MKTTICVLLLLFCQGLSLVAAQETQPEQIIISIAAEDATHNAVTDLKPNDVSIRSAGGRTTPGSVIYTGAEPTDWVLLIDTSKSMTRTPLWRPAIKAAFDQLIGSVRAKSDHVAVVSFDNSPELVQDFTGDEHRLNDAIKKLEPAGGTAFFEALVASLGYLTRSQSQGRQKAILAITDGVDNQSQIGLREVLARFSGAGVPVFLLLVNEATKHADARVEESDQLLRKHVGYFAENSGGAAFQPLNQTECSEDAKNIVALSSKAYLISFPFSGPKTGGIQLRTSRPGVSLLNGHRVFQIN